MLREFWFPLFLTLAGTVPGIAGNYAEGTARKVWWTVALLIWTAAGLSYIWGDPVRGPFYGLRSPTASDQFRLHAGGTFIFPIRDLSTGIDFSRAIQMGNSNPITLMVSRTWWNGWQYTVSLRLGPEQEIRITNKTIEGLPTGWDFNNDETALEVISPTGQPVFQLIQSSDYDIYVNAMLTSMAGQGGKARHTILNGNTLLVNADENTRRQHELTPIFKYPRYRNQGVRS